MMASVLIAALARKHSDAVFVPECKDGPTQTRNHRRLDAWVLLKTWSPITTIGYEVKVSRSDWRRDEKIADYFPLCHVLNIVAPKGVIPVDELPAGVGLLELAGDGDGARLITKRKAARREIELPSELLVYVLMCRSRITRERTELNDRSWTVEALARWVDGKADRQKLSHAVSQKIRDAFAEQERRQEDLERRAKNLEAVRDRIVELGFNPDESVAYWHVQDRLRQISGVASPALIRLLRETETRVASAREALETIATTQTKEPAA